MQSRGWSTPLVPLPRRRAGVTLDERLYNPHRYGSLQAQTLTAILALLDKGHPEEWAELVEFALITDPALRADYDTRVMRVVQAEYQVVPNQFGNQRQAQLAAELVDECLARTKQWRRFLKHALHAEALGFSCAEIDWARDGARMAGPMYYPERIRGIHPHRFRYDEQWIPRIYDRGSRRLDPKKQISDSSFGRYGEVLNPSGWVVHIGGGVGGYPTTSGYMRSAIWTWMFKRWVSAYYIMFIEKYGSGRAHGVVPKGATKEVRDKALEALELWVNDGFAVLEDGSNIVIDAMDAATSSETAHAQYMSMIDGIHTKLILGTSDASGPGENGSQAAVGARTGATMDPRMVSDGLSLCDTLHDQPFYWICYFNRHLFDGGNVPPVPTLQFKTASDEQKTDVQDLAQQQAVDAGQPRKPFGQVPGALDALKVEKQAGGDPNSATLQHPGEANDTGQPVGMADTLVGQPGFAAAPQPVPPPAATGKPGDVKQALDVVRAAKAGEVSRASACRMLTHFFGVDPALAMELVGQEPAPAVAPMTAQPPATPQPGQQALPFDQGIQVHQGGQHEAPIDMATLLSEVDALLGGGGAPAAVVDLKFNPGQPRDEVGKWTDGANAIGGESPINAEQKAGFEAKLNPERKAAIDGLKAKLAGSEPPTAGTPTPGSTPHPQAPQSGVNVDSSPPKGARPMQVADGFDDKEVDQVVSQVSEEDRIAWGGETAATVAHVAGFEAAGQAQEWTHAWVTKSTPALAKDVHDNIGTKGTWANAYYEATQSHMRSQLAKLQADGVVDKDGYLTLYRGVTTHANRDHKAGDPVSLGVRPVSSWSSNPAEARSFANGGSPKGAVLTQKVHYSRIFAAHTANQPHSNPTDQHRQKNNWYNESEYVVYSPEGTVDANVHK